MSNRVKGETSSLVLGIISLIFTFLGEATIIGLILAILATVFGCTSRKNGGNSAGFILGIIGIIINAVLFLLAFFLVYSIALYM